MKKIRLGIIGTGSHGTGHVRNIRNGLTPEIEVAAVVVDRPAAAVPAHEGNPAPHRFRDGNFAVRVLEFSDDDGRRTFPQHEEVAFGHAGEKEFLRGEVFRSGVGGGWNADHGLSVS